MSRRTTLIAALAATALSASPALARPVDDGSYARAKGLTSSLAGTVSPSQDLRGERAKDPTTVAAPAHDLRGERAKDPTIVAAPAQDLRGERGEGRRGRRRDDVRPRPLADPGRAVDPPVRAGHDHRGPPDR